MTEGREERRERGKGRREGGREEEMLSFPVLGLASLEITENFVIALRSNRTALCTLTCR